MAERWRRTRRVFLVFSFAHVHSAFWSCSFFTSLIRSVLSVCVSLLVMVACVLRVHNAVAELPLMTPITAKPMVTLWIRKKIINHSVTLVETLRISGSYSS